MGQDGRGRPLLVAGTFYGRDNITRFLARVPTAAIPWNLYTLIEATKAANNGRV